MGTDAGLYRVVLVLHILAVVVGIGNTMLNGVYAAKAKKAGGPGAGSIMGANLEVTMLAEKVIYAIPVLGVILVLLSDDLWAFDQTWIWLSIILFIIALGISHGMMMPAGKRMMELGAKLGSGQGGPEDAGEAQALEKRLAMGGMTLNLMVVAFLVLMIWKPGAPGFGF